MNAKNMYTDYTDFLKDKKFIQWQLIPDNSLNGYWENYILKHPENTKELQRAIEYLKTTGLNKHTLEKEDSIRLLNKIESTLRRNGKKKRIRRFIRYAAAICVGVVLIGGITFYLVSPQFLKKQDSVITGNILENQDIQLITGSETIAFRHNIQMQIDEKGEVKIKYKTETEKPEETVEMAPDKMNKLIVPFGKRTDLSLSDGSKIWLNSGSEIEFPAQFTEKNRKIRLVSGEIYVEVSPDEEKPFYVQTSEFSIQVYGTKFNISAYSPSAQSVVLIEGRVGIQVADQKEIVLKPNEQAISTGGGTFKTQKVNSEEFVSWKDGFLTFRQTPIEEVLRQIGRYYNIRFDYAPEINLKNRTCTGKIYLSDNLENVMTTITLLSNTKYKINETQIQIFNNPD